MIGTTVSHFRIDARLGEGGMGVVYRAEDVDLKREVALKFLPQQVFQKDDVRHRFIKEAQTASSVEHTNICTIYEIGRTDDGRTFIAMPLYRGKTLAERISEGPLDVATALDFVRQVGEGLARVHREGIIHRDIKPENIFITDDGVAKILDFGLAIAEGATRLTRSGTAVGTATYMAPEQIRGEDADERCDIWALGTVLYEMLTGRPPFVAEHEAALFYSILNNDQEPVSSLRPGVSPELASVLKRTMAKDRANRFESVGELLSELRVLGSGPHSGDGISSARSERRSGAGRRWVGAAVLMAAAVAVWLGRGLVGDANEAQAVRSIAVLPLEDISEDASQRYFADGMTEQLIVDLSRVEALVVISRQSVMRYRGSDQPITAIASELGVDAVVHGSVLHVGGQVRISASLVDGRSDRNLWAESYVHDTENLLRMQREVAAAIAASIGAELAPHVKTTLAAGRAVDPAALDAYLRGRNLWSERTSESVQASIEALEQAIDIDADFAEAWAGLADAYIILPNYSDVAVLESYPKARECAEQALALDSTLASAYNALSEVAYIHDLDYTESERLRLRALEMNPSSATAHQWYAEFLAGMGRYEEAQREIQRAKELDPLSRLMPAIEGGLYVYAGQYERALAVASSIVDAHPDFALAREIRCWALESSGRMDEAVEEKVAGWRLMNADPAEIEAVRAGYRDGGRAGYFTAIANVIVERGRESYVPPRALARVHAAAGSIDETMKWLEKSYEVRDIALLRLKVSPVFDPYREDPRFREIMKKIGLDD